MQFLSFAASFLSLVVLAASQDVDLATVKQTFDDANVGY